MTKVIKDLRVWDQRNTTSISAECNSWFSAEYTPDFLRNFLCNSQAAQTKDCNCFRGAIDTPRAFCLFRYTHLKNKDLHSNSLAQALPQQGHHPLLFVTTYG